MLHLKQLIIWIILVSNLLLCEQSLANPSDAKITPIEPPTTLLSESLEPTPIGVNMLHYKDPHHVENIHSIMAGVVDWKTIERTSPNFGFTDTAYWFKFIIQNTQATNQNIYIELPIPFLDDVKIYHTEHSEIIKQHTVGDMYPFSERPIIHQNFVLPFELKPGKNLMYLRVASDGTVEVPLKIWRPREHAESSANDHMIQGLWSGMLGIMIIYNLLLFFSIREKSYFYYVMFSSAFLLFQIGLRGYGFAYLWPEQVEWNSYAISTFIALCNISVALLVIHFLHLKETNPIANTIMSTIAIIASLLFILTFIAPYSITIRATSLLTMLSCSLAIILGYISLAKGDSDAKYYCLAWTATFVGISILGAVKFGMLAANFWTNNAGQIGVVIMVALLSFALANRINREKELRLSAQESALESEIVARKSERELLKTKTETNDRLKALVEEKTYDMQTALTELEQANTRLEIASTTDSLTTLFNRGHFENRLNIEFKRATRHKHELSAIICDIDHFKSVNDNYGHKTGDDCLRHVALIFKNKIIRSGDLIARYGGEEFIILLVDTPLSKAEYLAQSLCDEFRRTKLKSGDQSIAITVSFGVASLTQKMIDSPDDLINRADEALYLAKNSGRDQVQTWQEKTSDS